MEINESIGERLREVRESMGRSQTEFAEIAAAMDVPGATRQSQAKYEKGLAAPSASYLAAIAAAGADVLYILTGQRACSASVKHPPALAKDEEMLLDNYRNSPPDAKAAIKAASDAFARPAKGRSKAA